MTLSPDTRRADRLKLLTAMLDAIGDRYHDEIRFAADEFDNVNPTAWLELKQAGLVAPQHAFGSPGYEFTAHGWLEALRATGQLDTPEVAERCERLRKVLKGIADAGLNDGPHHEQLFEPRWMEADSGLPQGWMFNALRSNLLVDRYPDEQINHYYDASDRLFRLPANFGRKRLHGV